MFCVGDKVESIDSKAAFTVLQILPNAKLLVEDEFGLEYEISQQGLFKMNGKGVAYVAKSIPEIKNMARSRYAPVKQAKQSYINTFKVSSKGKAHVDLHLHEILPDSVHIEPNKALDFQIRVFEQAFDKAVSARVKEFMIVHGYGKGVLRSEIRSFLKGKGIEFMDADYGEYGQGATRCFMR